MTFSYLGGIPGDELWILPWDQHPNARGHRLFYKALSDRLHELPPSCWVGGSSEDLLLSPAGRDIKWVSNQLRHRGPSMMLRTYAHVLPDVEVDLSFSDSSPGGPSAAAVEEKSKLPEQSSDRTDPLVAASTWTMAH